VPQFGRWYRGEDPRLLGSVTARYGGAERRRGPAALFDIAPATIS
jgi:hypothetical protein